MERVIKEFLEKGEDKESVYHKIMSKNKQANKEQVYADTMSFLFGGHETASRAFTTAILVLTRYPDVKSKLQKEFDSIIYENGKYGVKDIKERVTGEILEQCYYLTMFVKEVMRWSAPGGRSLGYKANRDIQLSDGVFVPKGQIMAVNVLGAHYYPTEW